MNPTIEQGYIALSRLLHLDGLSSSLMFLSLLALLVYFHRGRRRVYYRLPVSSPPTPIT